MLLAERGVPFAFWKKLPECDSISLTEKPKQSHETDA